MNTESQHLGRRQFLASTAAAIGAWSFAQSASAQEVKPATIKKFGLHYAPHPGMFKEHAGNDDIAQIRFAAAQGFTAWEDNGMPGKPVEMQEKIGATLKELGMGMGVFVGYGNFDEPIFARANHPKRNEVLDEIRKSVDVCKRTGAKCFTVVPGSVDQQHVSNNWNLYGGPRLTEEMQTANAIDLLRQCAEILEPHGIIMVLEPLNWKTDHGGVFLKSAQQGYALCRAVNSPSCKVLYDVYHEQITAGNIINTMDLCWSEIAYIQSGDNPGRQEPGTGEMNYKNIFRHLATKSKDLIIGMEHGNSKPGKDGEQAVIDAYRAADIF